MGGLATYQELKTQLTASPPLFTLPCPPRGGRGAQVLCGFLAISQAFTCWSATRKLCSGCSPPLSGAGACQKSRGISPSEPWLPITMQSVPPGEGQGRKGSGPSRRHPDLSLARDHQEVFISLAERFSGDIWKRWSSRLSACNILKEPKIVAGGIEIWR